MKKIIKRILKIVAGVCLTVVVLVTGTVFVLNTATFQNKLMKYATEMLSDKLQTKVSIDSVSIGLFSQDVRLYGLDVEDLQHRKMLLLDTLSVDVDLFRLLRNEVRISEAKVHGIQAQLYKPSPDSAANYQFVIDAFKKDKTEQAEAPEKKKDEEKKGKKLSLHLSKLSLSRIHVTYNDQAYSLQKLLYKTGWKGKQTATVDGLQRSWVSHTKKGDVQNRLAIGDLKFVEEKGQRHVDIGKISFTTDNHQPRKNKGKPHRGAFDAGHLDISADARISILSTEKDSMVAVIDHLHAVDNGSGLTLADLQAKALVRKSVVHLSDVMIHMPQTELKFSSGEIQLPSKKQERPLAFSTSPISGRVMLKDIAKPFAPVLKNFSLPLLLRVKLSGTADEMKFSDVFVSTTDKALTIAANGGISNLKDKYKMNVHFHVGKMVAKGGVKEKIINQFPVKKFMMKQLHALGTVTYTGNFNVLYKKEVFQGLLSTAGGKARVNLSLDESTKYVFGTVSTDSFMLGKVMDMPDIGKIVCKADFKFDISKPRTAQMRKVKGGKLPIGEVTADVQEAKYKKIKVRNMFVTMVSDGAVADGKLTVKGKRMDVLCGFTFTNTDAMSKMKVKVKPGLKFHGLSEEDKAAKAAEKEEKRQAKAERKEERRQARAERKEEKRQAKAAEKEEKQQLKQQKAEEKAAKKQQKAEEKALRKQQKAEEKAQRKQNKQNGSD